MALNALDDFADEQKTHLGRQCYCDWMRSIDFQRYWERCFDATPFTVDRAMPSLQVPNGASVLLSVVALAQRVLLPYCANNSHGTEMFVPILCLLPTDGNRLCNDAAVKKAMNRVCTRAGDRFVHKYTTRYAYNPTDFMHDH
ncbi:unnamed protein product [Peronospora belbahrii]|uniref:Uncharacterized protein n=1 Tax=Peronospora belbahrii TaxID=622444 RepID=A0AAU9L797_9STRA|nr:unnamed protein product [Peronospora belbahrii]